MKKSFVRRIVVAVQGILVIAIGFSRVAMAAEVLQATDGQQCYRDNMHTHWHWSDGDDYLEMISLWYRDHGYQFLVFTDHNVLANTERWIDVARSAGGYKAYEN